MTSPERLPTATLTRKSWFTEALASSAEVALVVHARAGVALLQTIPKGRRRRRVALSAE